MAKIAVGIFFLLVGAKFLGVDFPGVDLIVGISGVIAGLLTLFG